MPDLTTVLASYSGLTATATDQAGKNRRQVADTLGRTVRVDEPDSSGSLGAVTTPNQPTYYEYDGNDNLTRVLQTGSGSTQERLFKYDSLSRLVAEKQVEAVADLDNNGTKVSSGGLWTGVYKYDTQGLLLEGTDARGVKTAFTYDGLNRTKTVAFTGETGYTTPSVTYTYDEDHSGYYNKGRLTTVQTAANTGQGTPATIQAYDFDKVGEVVNHTQSIGNQSYNLQYGYNIAGQLVSETYPSGKVINTPVDNFGQLSTVSDSLRTYLNGVTINNQGLLSQLNLGNGTNETFSYNDRFQMTNQNLQRGSEVLQKYDYSYGTTDLSTGNIDSTKNNGQLGKIEGTIGTAKQWSQRFGYDELGRLKEAREYRGDDNSLTYKQVFDFDRLGNMYRKAANNPSSGQQNPLPYTPIEDADISKSTNRLASSTTYDEAGQVVNDAKFRNIGFAYDANGRQVKATKTNVSDAWTVYDALGNRVATKVNDVWQYTIYDAFGKLVAEYGLSSSSSTSGTPEASGSSTAYANSGIKYIQQDWQGSPRTVTSNTGFVVARTDNTAFGEEIQAGVGLRTAQQGFGAASPSRQRYGSTEKDDATGLNHTWFRKNENRAGRWTSPDTYKGSMSLNDPQSFNRYSYVGNKPTNFVDPSGLLQIWICYLPWTKDSQGNKIYSSGWCDLVFDDGGGGPFGGGDNGGGGGGITGIHELGQVNKGPCSFPGYDNLSAAQEKLLGKDGKQRYDGLENASKANFLNQTGNLAGLGIELGDATLQEGDTGIDTDRLKFNPGSSLDTLKASVAAALKSKKIQSDKPDAKYHTGMSDSGGRQNVTYESQQFGFGPGGAFVDIDRGNPLKIPLGLIRHLKELASGKKNGSLCCRESSRK